MAFIIYKKYVHKVTRKAHYVYYAGQCPLQGFNDWRGDSERAERFQNKAYAMKVAKAFGAHVMEVEK